MAKVACTVLALVFTAQTAVSQETAPPSVMTNSQSLAVSLVSKSGAIRNAGLPGTWEKPTVGLRSRSSMSRDEGICGRSGWKCVTGGMIVGSIVGGLIGNSFIPHSVYRQTEPSCGFLGCGSGLVCTKNCDEPVTRIWIGGFIGAVLGGYGGHVIADRNSHRE